jgi:hypothetical protein
MFHFSRGHRARPKGWGIVPSALPVERLLFQNHIWLVVVCC